jgi:hypothetical protein
MTLRFVKLKSVTSRNKLKTDKLNIRHANPQRLKSMGIVVHHNLEQQQMIQK